MKEKIAQLEQKLNELERMENQIELELLKISDEAKKTEKYEYGQLVPYSYEERVTFIPEENISVIREKNYKSYDMMPQVYKDFHSFAEYVEGHSAPHGYPNKEYDMGLHNRPTGIILEILFSIPLCIISGLIFGFIVMWLSDISYFKSFLLAALGTGIFITIGLLKQKIIENNMKEPLDDADYVIEKAKYEAIVDERNKKLAAERERLADISRRLEEVKKAQKAVKDGLKILKKDGN